MAALQYPIVIAEMPVRWDEPAWLPDPSPVFEDTANANYNMIRDIESHEVLLQQLVGARTQTPSASTPTPSTAGTSAARPSAGAAAGPASGEEEEESDE
ncbi:hypothetical protein PENTCL1PPCAC_12887, partial [Pristionchus entomophagus]